jgi:small-conductance mechanosensitive channel
MPGAGHRFYFVGKLPFPFFVLLCLLFVNTFLMLLPESAEKYFLPKTTLGALHWYQDNAIKIQFVLLALLAAVAVIFRKGLHWSGHE